MPEEDSSDERPVAVDPLRPLPPLTWQDRVNDVVQRWRDAELSHAPVGVLVGAGLGVVALAGIVAWVALSLLRPAQAAPPEESLPRASTTVAGSIPSTTAAGVLVVQAAGAVNAPGLYRLPTDARVDDLVRAAGGFAADADPDRVNLAAPIDDGTRVYIPHRGEAQVPEAVAGASPAASASSGGSGGGPARDTPVNLNRATEADLEALPGIGPALAQAIVDYRTAHGSFTSIDQLLEVQGIGQAKLDQVRPLVTL